MSTLIDPASSSFDSAIPSLPRILLVDDDSSFRELVGAMLRLRGFEVVEAKDVPSALRLVAAQSFDALLSDLHMPAPGDGLTVVSAMRHSQPRAVTILMSAFPEMAEAAKAILSQADQVLVKPLKVDALIAAVSDRLRLGAGSAPVMESVASILEQNAEAAIEEWLRCLDAEPLSDVVPLDEDARCAYLPQFFRELTARLRSPPALGRNGAMSPAAAEHGRQRRRQGYSAAMLVEESRLLQASIFRSLQNNLHKVDLNQLLAGVMGIADEVDSQLAQQVAGYVAEPAPHQVAELTAA